MANNNNINNSEDIHIKVDQNNLIYIDPNSTIDTEGVIKPRNLQAENLIMYANLEADIVERSILASTNDTNTLTSIASGTLNFLKNNRGGDYDATWTESYLDTKPKKDGNGSPTGDFFQSDSSGQSFGIDSISIQIKGFNAIPNVNIKFVDVRGKTLFESPENSPYKAFFHIPWPIFYLTVKGFYGKAIKYRLHLVKFTSKFNEANGNFEVDTTFVGSTYAWLSDIPLQGIMNAPYLFPTESTKSSTSNTSTGQQNEIITKSTRGYELLKTVYDEYKAKGLIAQDFPVKTLREVITISNSLDSLLEKQIFDQVVDMRLFAGLKEFEENINNFETAIIGWGNLNLDKTTPATLSNLSKSAVNGYVYYYIKDSNKPKTNDLIFGQNTNGSLEKLLYLYCDNTEGLLTKNKIFTENLLNNTRSVFNKSSMVIGKVKTVGDYTNYISEDLVIVAIESIVDDIRQIRKDFYEQRTIFENDIETKMNEVVLDKNKGFGFSPTIRNLFAVILSNAEVLIRLMKDTHKKAFDQAEERKEVVGKFSKESTGESIYPWPEIKATVNGKENTIIYPGDPDFQQKLGSYNSVRWPEVSFLETYIGISTNKVDPLADKEGGINKIQTIINNNSDSKNSKKISTASSVTNILPYVNKEPSSFIYEIWERALNYTLLDSFNDDTIKELAQIEFQNIKNSIVNDNTLLKILHDEIKSETDLPVVLKKVAPYENYSYYQDQLPTTDYLKSFYNQSYNIEQYVGTNNSNDTTPYPNLVKNINNYSPEDYRTNIYPFSSDLYSTYLNNSFTKSSLISGKFLQVDTTQGLVSGQIDPNFWVKNGIHGYYTTNLFSQPILVKDNATLILNTPYFHNQLFNDFNKLNTNGKYVGSAYLLLNSLPFVDLSDTINYTLKDKTNVSVLVSSLFREVGSSQYIPYHLILKWGSIYHRYKTYLQTGVDILTGCTTSNTNRTTKPISGRTFFDNGNSSIPPLFLNGTPITYTIGKDVGIHPYYDAIFHQIVNGYEHFNYKVNFSSSFETNVTNGKILLNSNTIGDSNKLNYWTQFVDNSKYGEPKDLRYTFIPSSGGNLYGGKKIGSNGNPYSNNSFEDEGQNNYRVIWEDEYINDPYNNITLNSPNEYIKSATTNKFSTIEENYKKVFDLIATFSPDILDDFENYFINFSSDRLNLSVSDKPFNNVVYDKFQDLLQDLVTIPKLTTEETNIGTQINKFKDRQVTKLKSVTSNILSNSNLVKITIGNPKEIDPHVFDGFAKVTKPNLNTFNTNEYNSSQITTGLTGTTTYLKLYLGEEPVTNCYLNFFINNNIELSKENIILFRPLIFIYSGWVNRQTKLNPSFTPTKTLFQNYIISNVYVNPSINLFGTSTLNGSSYRLSLFLTTLIGNFKTLNLQVESNRITFFDGYNNKALKVELYNFFKSMNDKWIAGNSIGQRSLLEEFLFLDKANKDIGDQYYFDISRLTNMGSPENSKQNLFSAISILLQDTGFDIRALPAYINFYGTNFSNKPKLTPSKTIAKNLFGTFLEVDTQDSSPKIIIQYVGKNSVRPDMKDNKKFKFTDDSYNIGSTNNNPVMITLPKVFKTGDLAKTNKVVAFEVSFGDQNQSIFKGLTLDQASIKNTSESFYVLENLARSESGAASYNVDIGLFEYYRQAAYSCEVTCIGNVMIQPTMFFYLKNIPMFKGTYWITEVSHNIRNNNITTTFKGSRMPYTALPDLKDSFMSSYRTLFDKLTQKAQNRVNGADKVTTTSTTVRASDGNTYVYDAGVTDKKLTGEEFDKDASITTSGIPYNGFNDCRFIQRVTNNKPALSGTEWLRARVVLMGGTGYTMENTTSMSIISKAVGLNVNPSPLKWDKVQTFTDTYYFYATNFQLDKTFTVKDKDGKNTNINVKAEDVIKYTTTFINPIDPTKKVVVTPSYSLVQNVDPTIPIKFQGPIDLMKTVDTYGIALSSKLMTDLNVQDGDVIYFNLTQ